MSLKKRQDSFIAGSNKDYKTKNTCTMIIAFTRRPFNMTLSTFKALKSKVFVYFNQYNNTGHEGGNELMLVNKIIRTITFCCPQYFLADGVPSVGVRTTSTCAHSHPRKLPKRGKLWSDHSYDG